MEKPDNRLHELRSYRSYELLLAANSIPASSRILELGAGSGWQAHQLSHLGHSVEALDIEDSRHLAQTVYPVKIYDGHTLPYDSSTFDVVFSSNVLEHVLDIDGFEKEIYRVLKPGGMAVHILPTTSWRLWTSLTHPLYIVRKILELLSKRSPIQTNTNGHKPIPWINAFWPNRHGERGNSLTELYWFSRGAWITHFRKAGWEIVRDQGCGIFYTGNQILHRHINTRTRKHLSRILGSVTHIYVLKPQSEQLPQTQ